MIVFHAHVYFDEFSQHSAAALRSKAESELQGQILGISRLINHPIGPHPLPMFEIDFIEEHLADLYLWLRQNHGVHSVLIHKDVQPEIPEHTLHATWIGQALELDLSKLDIDGQVNAEIMKLK